MSSQINMQLSVRELEVIESELANGLNRQKCTDDPEIHGLLGRVRLELAVLDSKAPVLTDKERVVLKSFHSLFDGSGVVTKDQLFSNTFLDKANIKPYSVFGVFGSLSNKGMLKVNGPGCWRLTEEGIETAKILNNGSR